MEEAKFKSRAPSASFFFLRKSMCKRALVAGGGEKESQADILLSTQPDAGLISGLERSLRS